MEVLQWIYWGNSVQAWLVALGFALVVLVALRLAQARLARRLVDRAARTESDADALAAEVARKTRTFFPLIVAVYVGVQVVTLPPVADRIFRAILVVAFLLQAALWGNAVVSFSIGRYMRQRMETDAAAATSIGAVRVLVKVVLWTLVLLLVLDNLGVDVTALVTGLGIGGIAVALAAQNVLGDLFASLMIALDKPFVIGDFIVVGDFLGSVEHVGLKTTRVRSLSGEQLVFSNSDLLDSRIRNYKRMAERRIVFNFGVVYETPADKLAAIPGLVREIIEAHETVRFDRSHFKGYGDFALNFEVVYYVLSPDYAVYMDTQQAINLELYRRLAEQGIAFAYPTQTLYLRKDEPLALTA
jgi:small-conductance mechanosensitive channel